MAKKLTSDVAVPVVVLGETYSVTAEAVNDTTRTALLTSLPEGSSMLATTL